MVVKIIVIIIVITIALLRTNIPNHQHHKKLLGFQSEGRELEKVLAEFAWLFIYVSVRPQTPALQHCNIYKLRVL